MTGLPLDTPLKSLNSMKQSCETKADFLRIYPTLVLKNTPLSALYAAGTYQPQELAEAVQITSYMLALAMYHDIPVIRLGLSPSPSLEQALIAGPYHPAFGQLAYGALKLEQALLLLEKANGEAVSIVYPKNERPLLFGQKNEQWHKLQKLYPNLITQEKEKLESGALQVVTKNDEKITLTQTNFLQTYIKFVFNYK
jgi:histone acetyltransferase (RNA polymerase elongator complex component)